MYCDEHVNIAKITFLFGAGADAEYKIPTGEGFNEALLTNAFDKERKQLLGGDFSQYHFICHNSTKVFVQTIVENFDLAKRALAEKECVDCKDYYEKIDDIEYTIIKDYCKKWYNKIHSNEKSPAKTFFLNNAIFFDSLDEKFNALRRKPLDGRAKRVINAYTTVFILMLKSVYKIPDTFNWTFNDVFNLLNSTPATLKADLKQKTYYKILLDSKLDFNLATTNYTAILENVIRNKEIAYLHGNLHWFENYDNLLVYDCKSQRKVLEKFETIMPFILIPSGVKPIISTKQIEQFSNFLQFLKGSKYLCVIGYKFNKEDNHVNSMIGEWLNKENNKLIYFNYNNSFNWDDCRWNNCFSVADEIEKINEVSIVNIDIDDNNKHDRFIAILNYLKNT